MAVGLPNISKKNTSACAYHSCDINLSCILAFHPASLTVRTQTIRKEMGEHYKFVNHFMKKVYIYCMYLGFIPLNLVFKWGTFFVRHAPEIFYWMCNSPHVLGKADENVLWCSKPAPIYSYPGLSMSKRD